LSKMVWCFAGELTLAQGELRIGLFALRDVSVHNVQFFSLSLSRSCESFCRSHVLDRRQIERGTELTFDYQFERYGDKPQQCFCGAPSCRKFIGSSKQVQSSGARAVCCVGGRPVLKRQWQERRRRRRRQGRLTRTRRRWQRPFCAWRRGRARGTADAGVQAATHRACGGHAAGNRAARRRRPGAGHARRKRPARPAAIPGRTAGRALGRQPRCRAARSHRRAHVPGRGASVLRRWDRLCCSR
jgi:hypothetical protein